MAKKKKSKKNEKIKKQIKDTFVLTIIISICVVALFKIISLISSPTKTIVVRKNTISSEESKVGYVIRDEYVIESENENKTIKPIKNEGERVATNNPVYKYYNENEEEIIKQIEELNGKIQEALLEQKDLFPSDVKAIEGQIEKQLEKLKNENNMQNIIELKNNIAEYTLKKAKIAGSLSIAGTYINDLISQRNAKEEELANGTEYVKSNISGIVSYRIDGLESKLTVDDLDNLTLKDLNGLKLKTGQIVGKSSTEAKIINNFKCYIAVGFDKGIKDTIKEGNKATIRLSNQEEVKAEVYKIKEDDGQTLVIFKITDDVEKLISYRKISLDVIWWSYTGLMIPKNAILYENSVSYVYRKKNNNTTDKLLVKVVKENDNYCIIDNYDSEELIEMGFSSEEIKDLKQIKLYDEIIINPEMN